MDSSSSGCRMDATSGGSDVRDEALGLLRVVACAHRHEVARPRCFSAAHPIRYSIASMMPQARLHPSAPTSITRTSSRPAWATLSEPVKVSTMISPNSTSDARSIGSSTCLEDFTGRSGMDDL